VTFTLISSDGQTEGHAVQNTDYQGPTFQKQISYNDFQQCAYCCISLATCSLYESDGLSSYIVSHWLLSSGACLASLRFATVLYSALAVTLNCIMTLLPPSCCDTSRLLRSHTLPAMQSGTGWIPRRPYSAKVIDQCCMRTPVHPSPQLTSSDETE
jgi:hypothetical protein